MFEFALYGFDQRLKVVNAVLLVRPRHMSCAQRDMLMDTKSVVQDSELVKVVNARAQGTLSWFDCWFHNLSSTRCELTPSTRPHVNVQAKWTQVVFRVKNGHHASHHVDTDDAGRTFAATTGNNLVGVGAELTLQITISSDSTAGQTLMQLHAMRVNLRIFVQRYLQILALLGHKVAGQRVPFDAVLNALNSTQRGQAQRWSMIPHIEYMIKHWHLQSLFHRLILEFHHGFCAFWPTLTHARFSFTDSVAFLNYHMSLFV